MNVAYSGYAIAPNGFFLQDMSMSVALNNIQSVDRGEDEKVLYQMILFIPANLKH